MDRLRQKTSTILISVGDKTWVYQSVDEVPPRLREKLLETTRGINSATILIADRGGREEILNAMRTHPPSRAARLAMAALARAARRRAETRRFVLTWSGLGRLLVLGSLGYLLWILISLR